MRWVDNINSKKNKNAKNKPKKIVKRKKKKYEK